MAVAYSPFFASGLLATSYYAAAYATPVNAYAGSASQNHCSLKPPMDSLSPIRVDDKESGPSCPLKLTTASSVGSISTTNHISFHSNILRSPNSSDVSTSPSTNTRHRRRRSSLSASITMSPIKPSARGATTAAVRQVTAGAATSLQHRRTRDGSFSLDRKEIDSSAPSCEAAATESYSAPQSTTRPRRGTFGGYLAPTLRIKRSLRRGPSPTPPPTSPLPALPTTSLLQVPSSAFMS